jgi:hypothetical protein
MDKTTRDQLKSLLKERLVELTDDQTAVSPSAVALPRIDRIIREARAEAVDEVKAIFKEAIVEAALESAIGSLRDPASVIDPVSPGEVEERPRKETPAPPSQPGTPPAAPEPGAPESTRPTREKPKGPEDQERLQREIEAIRQQIAQNEDRLSRMRSDAGEGEGAEAHATPASGEADGPAKPAVSLSNPPNVGPLTAGKGEASDEEDGSAAACGCYVYGIVEESGNDGLPEMAGIDASFPVYTLSCPRSEAGCIQALVSQVPLSEFGQEALEANLEDIAWVEQKVCAHQAVLESVLDSHTLLPMRFCTIYRSEERAREMLVEHYDRLMEALARFEGKQEWGVKLYCDERALSQQVERVSDRIKALKAEIDQQSSGAAYFAKKKMESAVEEEVERLADDYAQRCHDRLSAHAEEVVINALQDRQITGRDDTMVLNAAYLVEERRLEDFRATVADLQEEHAELGFDHELTGPWPPYSFGDIEET